MFFDLQRAFQRFGKLRDGVIDFFRLPAKRVEHVLKGFGPPANHLQGRKHEGNTVVYVMAQIGKLLFQLADLLDA